MIADFKSMPDDARLWVYQASRTLSSEETEQLKSTTNSFLGNWEAHGKPLKAAFELRYDQFLVLTVDESYNGATGCSIDSSVVLIRELEKMLAVSFLDRSKIAFMHGESVQTSPMTELRGKVSAGDLSQETLVFNNAVSNMGEYRTTWMVPASASWLKRYFR